MHSSAALKSYTLIFYLISAFLKTAGTLLCTDPTAYVPDAWRGVCVLHDTGAESQARTLSESMIAALAAEEGDRLCGGGSAAALPLALTLESLRQRLRAAEISPAAPIAAAVLERALDLVHLVPELKHHLESHQFVFDRAYVRVSWSCRVRLLVWRNIGSILAAVAFALLAAYVRSRLARRAFVTEGSACVADALRAHLSLRHTAMHSEPALMAEIGASSSTLRHFIADAEVWTAAKLCVLGDDRVLSGTRIERGAQVSCLQWVHSSEYVPADAS